jgi:hypothetical protein
MTMGLTTGDFPPVDPATFMETPYRERLKTLSRHWVEYGFGAPKITMLIYIAKLVFLYAFGGILIATLTSHLNPLHPSAWFYAPIVYQKMVLWTVLLECLGVAGSWGPLAAHFKPMTGGWHYWGRPGTVRVAPWPARVPFTGGDSRTWLDVVLYVALLASLIAALALPGTHRLIATASIIPIIALLVLLGLRDKVVFLAARSEQYLPLMIFFAFFPFVDMIVAAKLLIVTVWVGAGFSKFGRHFDNVVPPMVSNIPWLFSKRIKRMCYRNFPEDLRPSKLAKRLALGPGAFGELVPPLVLLFSQNQTVTLLAALLMIGYHLFITSTFPLAVPLEWNVLFMYTTAFLFLGYPAHDGYGIVNMHPILLAVTLAGLLFLPVLGNLRPDLVSFLPSMRQYAGNWASAMWALAPGAEAKLNQHIVKGAPMQKDQLAPMYGAEAAEVVLQQVLGWRSLHSQARGLNSVMINQLGQDVDRYTLREAEFSCNAIVGFNFGDGHFHDQRLIEAIQRRCQFAPGEFIVVWVESEPVGNGRQEYWVMDAAIGIVERGSWAVAVAVEEQPWLPNGPIATRVHWKMDGYERVSHGPVVIQGVAAPVEEVAA